MIDSLYHEIKVIGIKNGKPDMEYIAPNLEHIKAIMNKFFEIYKKPPNKQSDNWFFKVALMHLLFVKIHPYVDENDKTTKSIDNTCFTNQFNQIYKMKLYISPTNIS